jgi:hypothetical protein
LAQGPAGAPAPAKTIFDLVPSDEPTATAAPCRENAVLDHRANAAVAHAKGARRLTDRVFLVEGFHVQNYTDIGIIVQEG